MNIARGLVWEMEKELITYFVAAMLVMFSSTIMAEDNYVEIDSIQGVRVEDVELGEMIGKGASTFSPNIPDTVSIILWDEKGGGKSKTQYESMIGVGNVQNVNLRMERN